MLKIYGVCGFFVSPFQGFLFRGSGFSFPQDLRPGLPCVALSGLFGLGVFCFMGVCTFG